MRRTAALLLALASAPLGAIDVELLSRIPPRLAPATGGGGSPSADLSADGRFVVFESEAENLIAGVTDRNPGVDVFLFDRVTGETVLVSRSAGEAAAADQESRDPSISADGRFVAFTSLATDLVRGVTDDNAASDVFLYDRRTGTVSLVSRASASARSTAGAFSSDPAISADGQRVAFLSFATNLVPGQVDGNQGADVFLWERTTGRTDLVSHRAGQPTVTGSADSFTTPFVSADGARVAFVSRAGNLVSGQSGAGQNAFLWERASGRTTLVSHTASSRTEGAGGLSTIGGISADGSSVLYHSTALNIVPGQRERPRATHDIFLWSRSTGTSRLVSGREGSASVPGNRPSAAEDLSDDGAWAVFSSSATHLIRGLEHTHPGSTDVYLWSRKTGRTTLLSHAAGSAETTASGPSGLPRISADGRWITYLSIATDLEAGTRDTNGASDVILQSRNGDPEIVTLHARGLASATPSGPSAPTSIDASGRFVVYLSSARELGPPQRGSGVFLHDRATRTRTLVSGDHSCQDARISADGRFVAFACLGSVFLRSRETADTTLLAKRDGSSVSDLAISADGSVVAFLSASPELVTIFVWDRATGTASPMAGNRQALGLSLDASGRVLAFHSPATDLVTGVADAESTVDVFVLDRTAGTTTLVSRAADTPEAAGGFVFQQADSNGLADVFLYDRESGSVSLVSRSPSTASFTANGESTEPRLSADGRILVFSSNATDLAFDPGGPATRNLYVYDRSTGDTSLVSRSAFPPFGRSNGTSLSPLLAASGSAVAFTSFAPDLVLRDFNDFPDAFAADFSAPTP